MSDDLVKQLREHSAVVFDDRGHVFENELLCDQAADRIEELEVKLAKAVEALETIVDNGGAGSYHLARTTLAELKGCKDE